MEIATPEHLEEGGETLVATHHLQVICGWYQFPQINGTSIITLLVMKRFP